MRLSASKYRQGGYSIVTDPDAKQHTQECDTFTCAHCCKVTFVKPKCDPVEMGGRCTCCDKLICKGCAAKGGCRPIEVWLEQEEARGRMLREMGL